jgi:hypothetical protein
MLLLLNVMAHPLAAQFDFIPHKNAVRDKNDHHRFPPLCHNAILTDAVPAQIQL